MTSKKDWLKLMQQGQQNYQRGKFSEAIQFFSLATKTEPLRAEGWINMGVVQIEAGLNQNALITLQQAISLDPNLMPVHMALGDAHRLLGDLDAAFAAYQQAVRLQRTPMSLNKLAAIQRTRRNSSNSETLYQEALQMAPDFTLARVNLATLQIELQRFDEAKNQLNALEKLALSPVERDEVNSTKITLDLYHRLQPSIETAIRENDLVPMEKALQAIPVNLLQVDEEILEGIRRYADSARTLTQQVESEPLKLPDDWSLIEALFMIPFVDSVDGFLKTKKELAKGIVPTGNLLESVNMQRVVDTARDVDIGTLLKPIKAEVHLRHWHALATMGIEDMMPGQLKIVQNMTHVNVLKRRVEPHLATGTLRQFISEIYVNLPSGLPRGLVAMIALFDIHAFADGNGRLGITWLNRELESIGQVPALFNKNLGIKGKLIAAVHQARDNGNLSPLAAVIREAQQFSRDFCKELAKS